MVFCNVILRGESGYTEAIDLVQSVWSVGTTALVDEEDGQEGRSIAEVMDLMSKKKRSKVLTVN